MGICDADAVVEDSVSGMLPEAVLKEVSLCFISQDGGSRARGCSSGLACSGVISILDGGLDHDL